MQGGVVMARGWWERGGEVLPVAVTPWPTTLGSSLPLCPSIIDGRVENCRCSRALRNEGERWDRGVVTALDLIGGCTVAEAVMSGLRHRAATAAALAAVAAAAAGTLSPLRW